MNTAGFTTEAFPKKRRRLGDTLPILYLKSVLILLAGQFAGSFLTSIIYVVITNAFPSVEQSGAWSTGFSYISFIGIWLLLLPILYAIKRNRPILAAAWIHSPGNNAGFLLLGLFLGFALNGLCAFAAWLNQDIRLTYDSFHPLSLLLIFLTVFVQSSAEEMLCRGYLYQKLRCSYRHPAAAIVGSSLLFALLHLTNTGVTILSMINIFAFGILFSLIIYYYDSLWCAFALHAAWNFTQNILFGLPNSGLTMPYSIFKLDAASARDSLFYNVGFGIEGTLFSAVVLILSCSLLILIRHKTPSAAAQQQLPPTRD